MVWYRDGAQVADVSCHVIWSSVLLIGRIEVISGPSAVARRVHHQSVRRASQTLQIGSERQMTSILEKKIDN